MVAVAEDSILIFAQFSGINYWKHGSWYLERINVRKMSSADLWKGWFSGIGGNMKLEQTIQKVSIEPVGLFVARETHKQRSVAYFQVFFHEIVAVTICLS